MTLLEPTNPVPGVTHRLNDDGLRLTSTYDGPEGTIEAVVGWNHHDTALANYGNAMRGFETRLPDLIASMIPDRGTRRSRLSRARFLDVIVSTGAPTWWLPRLGISRHEVRGGWLRVAVQVRRRKRSASAPRTHQA